MLNLIEQLEVEYEPIKALVAYRSNEQKPTFRFEACHIKNKQLYNFHPITVAETVQLRHLLHAADGSNHFLLPSGLLPENVLYLDNSAGGFVMWYTPARTVNLLFGANLGIPSGKAQVPALLWKASKDHLRVFALKGKHKPTANTALFHAPFFNVHSDGNVCMGTVSIRADQCAHLQAFMTKWNDYFFNSYFTHIIYNPATRSRQPLAKLWKQLINDPTMIFPVSELINADITISELLQ